MLKVIQGSDSPELAGAYAFRHRIFVEEMGWEDLRHSSGLERDRFDGPEAVHMLLYEDGDVMGYQRFLPTTGPHLLRDVFPYMCDGPLPSNPHLYEWTRFAVAGDRRGHNRALGRSALELVLGLVEWCLAQRISGVVVQLEPVQMLKFVQCHFVPSALGVAHDVHGQDVIAALARFDERTLWRLQELLRVTRQ